MTHRIMTHCLTHRIKEKEEVVDMDLKFVLKLSESDKDVDITMPILLDSVPVGLH